MKECKKCEAVYPETEFYSHPNTKDKLSSYCKTCAKQQARVSYNKKWGSVNSYYWQDWLRRSEARQRRKALKEGKMKTCLKCNEEKPATVEHFYTGAGRHGFKSYCKPCDNALKTARRRAKKEAKKQ